MQIAWLIGLECLECLVLRPGRCRLQIAQIAHAMPPQAAVETRARDLRVQDLPHHRQQVIDRHQQCPAQDNRPVLRDDRSPGSIASRSNPAPGSAWFATGVACGCGHARCPGAAICRRFARSCRTVPPGSTRARHSPGSQPAPWAWSSPSPLSSDQWRTMARL